MNDLLSTLEQWHQDSEYQKIIDRLEELSHIQKLDYDLTCQLARAYNNIADLDKPEAKGQLKRAEELLRSVETEGTDDPLWHFRLGYSLFYQDREEEALAGEGRVLVRPSGTEALMRVMVEAKTQQTAQETAQRLADLIPSL